MTDFIRLPQRASPGGPGLLVRLLGTLAGVVVLAAAFVASAVLLVGLLAVGVVALGWFWWKTRAIRRAIREQRNDPLAADDPNRSWPRRESPDPRRPLRTDDVTDAQILHEEPLEHRGPQR